MLPQMSSFVDQKTGSMLNNNEQFITRLEQIFKQNQASTAQNSQTPDTINLMKMQIGRLDELINQMRNQVGISQKLLQYSK